MSEDPRAAAARKIRAERLARNTCESGKPLPAQEVAVLLAEYGHRCFELRRLRARLARIAEAHGQEIRTEDGYGACGDCWQVWPCPTRVWASTDRDPAAPWDPAEDQGVRR